MLVREKLRRRCQKFLEPEERIVRVFVVRAGLAGIGAARYAIVAVTDRSVVLFDASIWSNFKPRKLRLRGPRRPWTAQLSGLWGHIVLDRRYEVHRRWFDDVRAAEDDMGAA